MLKSIQKNAQFLTVFAIVCTTVISLVHLVTKDKIAQQEQQQLLSILSTIIEPSRHNNNIFQDCILINTDSNNVDNEKLPTYLAKQDQQPIAAAITTIAPDGYNGNIKLLVAVNFDGSVSGVRTLTHKETPGLGDKIELRKSDWITSFTNKKIINKNDNDNRWHVQKDGGMFDQFTGATITPRAVVKAVKNTVQYFNNNKQNLFNQTNNCRQEQ